MNKSPVTLLACLRAKTLMVKLGSQCPKQKSSVDFGDSDWFLVRPWNQGSGRGKEAAGTAERQDDGTGCPSITKMPKCPLKVGVPSVAEASQYIQVHF